jgi:hypothetical protein
MTAWGVRDHFTGPDSPVGVLHGEDLRVGRQWPQGGDRRPYNQTESTSLRVMARPSIYTAPVAPPTAWAPPRFGKPSQPSGPSQVGQAPVESEMLTG